MLREFDNICRTNGLKYWCVGEHLLEQLGHKGWIPYDVDIDVAMLKSDYKKLQKIIQKSCPKIIGFRINIRTNITNQMLKTCYLYAHYKDW